MSNLNWWTNDSLVYRHGNGGNMFSVCELSMQVKPDKYKDSVIGFDTINFMQSGILVRVVELDQLPQDVFYWVSTKPVGWIRVVNVRV